MRLPFLILLFSIASASLADPAARPADSSASASAPAVDPAMRRLVNQLAADDPAARETAEKQILAAGRSARPALVEAMESELPQLRAAASQLILQLPFDDPSDPPGVRALLARYGQAPPETRVSYLKPVVDASGDAAPAILLRLMLDEPTETVRWAIVGHFRNSLKGKIMPPLAQFDAGASVDRAPNVALDAWAWEKKDYPTAMKLYRRCLDLEAQRPTTDNGEADFVFETLFNIYLWDKQYDEAATVYRIQYARRPEAVDSLEGVTDKLDDLFALHSRFGPLKGFNTDVVTAGRYLGRPQLLYALGRLYENRAAEPMLADALYRAAWAVGMGSIDTRTASGEFLTNQHWDAQAMNELQAIIAMETRADSVSVCNAHLRLGLIHARAGDDFAAAEHQRTALEALRSIGGIVTRVKAERKFHGKEAEDLMWAEVHWHYFRFAKEKNDKPEMEKRIAEILTYEPDDEQIALDVMPVLIEQGRKAEAARLFIKPYAASKARLAEKPDDPEKLNNLAWLCARGAQNLDEALQHINKAIAAKPDNYAYLDTAAEIHFQKGDYGKSVELETRALKLKPNDEFIEKQLKKFQAAKKSHP